MADLRQVNVVEGALDAAGLRFCIAVSRFNEFITERLLEGAVDTLLRSGAAPGDITVIRVPGAWELPGAIDQALSAGEYDAGIALGCLIKGATIHFDLIAAECAKQLGAASVRHGKPVAFGVLTTDNLEQAIERAGSKAGNKGGEAAIAAVEQARVYAALTSGTRAPAAAVSAKKKAKKKSAKKKSAKTSARRRSKG
jgi:6,7-dimethyl-8-ribityllumazine synthase